MRQPTIDKIQAQAQPQFCQITAKWKTQSFKLTVPSKMPAQNASTQLSVLLKSVFQFNPSPNKQQSIAIIGLTDRNGKYFDFQFFSKNLHIFHNKIIQIITSQQQPLSKAQISSQLQISPQQQQRHPQVQQQISIPLTISQQQQLQQFQQIFPHPFNNNNNNSNHLIVPQQQNDFNIDPISFATNYLPNQFETDFSPFNDDTDEQQPHTLDITQTLADDNILGEIRNLVYFEELILQNQLTYLICAQTRPPMNVMVRFEYYFMRSLSGVVLLYQNKKKMCEVPIFQKNWHQTFKVVERLTDSLIQARNNKRTKQSQKQQIKQSPTTIKANIIEQKSKSKKQPQSTKKQTKQHEHEHDQLLLPPPTQQQHAQSQIPIIVTRGSTNKKKVTGYNNDVKKKTQQQQQQQQIGINNFMMRKQQQSQLLREQFIPQNKVENFGRIQATGGRDVVMVRPSCNFKGKRQKRQMQRQRMERMEKNKFLQGNHHNNNRDISNKKSNTTTKINKNTTTTTNFNKNNNNFIKNIKTQEHGQFKQKVPYEQAVVRQKQKLPIILYDKDNDYKNYFEEKRRRERERGRGKERGEKERGKERRGISQPQNNVVAQEFQESLLQSSQQSDLMFNQEDRQRNGRGVGRDRDRYRNTDNYDTYNDNEDDDQDDDNDGWSKSFANAAVIAGAATEYYDDNDFDEARRSGYPKYQNYYANYHTQPQPRTQYQDIPIIIRKSNNKIQKVNASYPLSQDQSQAINSLLELEIQGLLTDEEINKVKMMVLGENPAILTVFEQFSRMYIGTLELANSLKKIVLLGGTWKKSQRGVDGGRVQGRGKRIGF